ncbi:UDP pyrophosphate phosphatase [Sulfurifustis variabilis]|uniref:Undecaprenyl-diphosphatase n=1 Tax=Sulfurifustis variabilis TaxID=1675686 RepID=A0A1B4V578_9GAMM|nr:undecaprenyl-diphosphate phosphatase [Sulfurifustis variabilis]BAU48693.1 UDP pyrophosphate phosphatase [Sulfurifustis variabilis]
MTAWLVVQAVILGIVEGLTEFLPVSSTGHLIIVGDAMGFTGERAKTFEIFIQLGSIFGVMWHYRTRLADLALRIHRPPERRFVLNLLLAFLPAALVGLLLHGAIKEHLFNPFTVAGALVAGGVVILLIERLPRRERVATLDAIRPIDALKIGMAQTLALFPGVSRSGATIMGGLVAGLSRKAATEFSFFLAMPTMFAATLYALYKDLGHLTGDHLLLFAAGFVTAFFSALVVVRAFLAYVARHTFVPFAYYRIGFGLLVLAYFW